MDMEDNLRRLLRERPEYRDILERAVQVEDEPPSEFIRDYGWEWYNVAALPARLTKLVTEGILTIPYKSRRFTHYKLANKEIIKRVLRQPL